MVHVALFKAGLAKLCDVSIYLYIKRMNHEKEKALGASSHLRLPRLPVDSPTSCRHAAQDGFTLVEMLVTVVVMVVLFAIVFTVGRSSLQSARVTKAGAHLKQTGAILANYATENNNRLPPSADWGAIMYGGGLQYFQRYLSEFAGFAWNDKIPASPLPDFCYDPSLSGKRQHPMGSFGVNHSIVLNTWDSRRFGNELGTPIMSIPNPSSKVIYCTAKEPGWDSSWLFVGEDFARLGWQATSGPDPRHGGRVGALFLDGHVENLDVKNMDQAKRRRYFTSDP